MYMYRILPSKAMSDSLVEGRDDEEAVGGTSPSMPDPPMKDPLIMLPPITLPLMTLPPSSTLPPNMERTVCMKLAFSNIDGA